MQRSDIETRSPEVSSMSSSRGGWTSLDFVGEPEEVVGRPAHRAHDDHHVVPVALRPGDVVRDGADPLGVADRGAPELLHDESPLVCDASCRRNVQA